MWTFMQYVNFGGKGVISKWVAKDIEVNASDDFHDLLNILAVVPRDLWVRPDYDTLTPPDIGEIRWKSGQLQHRVFGFFKDEQYILLLGSTKKGTVYSPADAIATARQRKNDILNGWNQTIKYIWK